MVTSHVSPSSFYVRGERRSTPDISFALSVQLGILGATRLSPSQFTKADPGLAEVFLTCVLLTSTVKQCRLDTAV